MAIRLEATRRFEATSPVARYWLTQCKGFRVGGARKGTVEEIVSESDPYAPRVLVVRDVYRRREVLVSTVEAVLPAERLIIVGDGVAGGGRRRRQRRVHAAARSTLRAFAPMRVVLQDGRVLARQAARLSTRVPARVGLATVALVWLVRAAGSAIVRASAVAAASSIATLRACRRVAVGVGLAVVDLVRLLSARGLPAMRSSGALATSYAQALASYGAAVSARLAAGSRVPLPGRPRGWSRPSESRHENGRPEEPDDTNWPSPQ